MIRRYSKWLALLAAVIVLILVFAYNAQRMAEQANRPMPVRQTSEQRVDVSVIHVSASTYAAQVDALGAAEPHYQLTLSTQVAGRVAELADAFDSGRQVKKGDLLVQLEDSSYRSALASAENDLASVRVDLLEAQREADQARTEWENSGLEGEPDSPLVLHEPQVTAATAAVTDAEAAVASARNDLQQTRIRAPFDALIVSRSVTPGSYLQAGGEVASLYSTDRVEISLPLSQSDWSKLPDIATLDSGHWPVQLTAVETGQQWTGYVQRAEQHLDDSSRQQSVIAALDQPLAQQPVLAPGTFVRAVINGRDISNLWRLPASALSQRGEIWYVADNLLNNFSAEPVASDADAIYILVPENLRAASVPVLVHPLTSYMPGMAVNPIATTSAAGTTSAEQSHE